MRNRVLIAVAALVATPPLVAQRPIPARIQQLRTDAMLARERLTAYDDSMRSANARLDSVRVGPFRIQAEPSLLPLATRAAQLAYDSLRPRLGATLEHLTSFTFTMRVERHADRGRADSNVTFQIYGRTGGPQMNVRQVYDTALVARSIRLYVPYFVARDVSPRFVAWMENVVNVDTMTATDWRSVRIALASSPAIVGRHCFAGDLPACWIALGFTPVADTARQWYDAHDRRRIVRQNENAALRVDFAATRRCLDGDDFACLDLVRRVPNLLPAPIPTHTRVTLARTAIAMGGTGSVERLLDGDVEPLERLSQAAQAPVDSIISRWQRSARTAHASSVDMSADVALAATFWALALAGLSLRSSRWR